MILVSYEHVFLGHVQNLNSDKKQSEIMEGKVYLLALESILSTGEASTVSIDMAAVDSEMKVSVYSQEFGCSLLFTNIKSLQSSRQRGGPQKQGSVMQILSYIDI